MAGDRDAFVAALRERPDDHATAFVFADWLDERGREDLTGLIRLQARVAALAPGDRSEAAHGVRLECEEAQRLAASTLCRKLGVPEWAEYDLECVFRLGLLDALSIPVQWLIEGADALERDPALLRKMTVGRVNGWGERLAAVPLLRHVTELEVEAWLSPADARAIASSPHLKGLRTLEVWLGNTEGGCEETLAAFAGGVGSAYPQLEELRIIDVPGCSQERLTRANRLMGRSIARAAIPLPRLYPIAEELHCYYVAGHLPDGTQLLCQAPQDVTEAARLFRFTPAGQHTETQDLRMPAECAPRPGYRDRFEHLGRVKEYLRREMGFTPGLIRVLNLDDPDGGHSIASHPPPFGDDPPGTPDPPSERPEADPDLILGRAHRYGYYFRYGAYMFECGTDWWVGPDGLVEAT